MTRLISLTAATATAFLIATTGVMAKGHDNGVADGSPSGNANVGGETAGKGGNAISAGQKGGERGTAASGAKSANSAGKGNSPHGDE